MIVMRPVRLEDLDDILRLAGQAWFGLTSLPADRSLLKERVQASVNSFISTEGKPRGEEYLLVMEDLQEKRVIGTSGIVSKVGGFEPFYAYRIDTQVHESTDLNLEKEIRSLHLVMEHDGPCEIGSLFLDPQRRGGGLGRLLSRSRFLFMAEYPHRFEPTVIAEMRGVIDRQGRSPFWDAVGKHFFDMDFPRADYLSQKNKRILSDLMPRHPIYIPLLPPEAQSVIAQVHEKTRNALKMLEAEGFVFSGMVDIFEAGPIVECRRDSIRSVVNSRRLLIEEVMDKEPDNKRFLVSVITEGFRAVETSLLIKASGGALGQEAAAALGVELGDTVLAAPV